MSAVILRLRDALQQVAPTWHWEFSPEPHETENKFRLVARPVESEDPTVSQRVIFVTEKLLHQLPLRSLVSDIVRLLPRKDKELTTDEDRSLNLRSHYDSLCNDYRAQLERFRRQVQGVKQS